MSKNRVLLSALTVVAIVCMASECATAQLFSGRLFGRRNATCCAPAPAPAPTCCGGAITSTPYVSAPVVSSAVPTPAVVSAPVAASPVPIVSSAPVQMAAPIQMAAPVVSSCCGGGMIASPQMTYGTAMPMGSTVLSADSLPMEQGIVYGSETIVETGEAVQTSPSDNVLSEGTVESTTTSDLIEPPAAADAAEFAPEQN